MKRFKFSLQKILDLREREEDLKMREFGLCRRNYLDSEEKLKGLKDRKNDCVKGAEVKPGQGIDLKGRELYLNYLNHLGECINQQQEQVSKSEERMESAREKWLQKRQKKEILSRLKNKRQERYLTALRREEQKEIDDLVTTRQAFSE